MISTSGSAVAGEEYSVICAVMGADNLDASFMTELNPPVGDSAIVSLPSVTISISPLGQGDAGEYTCEAMITTALLLGSPITVNGMLDIEVGGKSSRSG